jgi:hypothetical protein
MQGHDILMAAGYLLENGDLIAHLDTMTISIADHLEAMLLLL